MESSWLNGWNRKVGSATGKESAATMTMLLASMAMAALEGGERGFILFCGMNFGELSVVSVLNDSSPNNNDIEWQK